MPYQDCFILMGVGGLFIILGLVGIIWGKREEESYDNALSTRRDLREFLEHWPVRPQPGALKVGGLIAITIGLLVLAAGVILWASAI